MASVFGPPASKPSSMPGQQHVERRLAFLIGPTNQGKSTCGSYLIDPETSEEQPVFKRRIGMKSMTQVLKPAIVRLKGRAADGSSTSTDIELTDTPGLADGSTADLQHMIEVYRELQRAGRISAIILFVSLERSLDAPFKVLLDFWRRLFKDVLRTNFFVIMSNVRMDSASINRRKKDGFDVDKAEEDLQQELRTYFQADSKTFTIIRMDGRPEGAEEQQLSLLSRNNVLRKIESLPQVDVSEMTFAKLPEMLWEDQALKQGVDREITGYIGHQEQLTETLGVSAKKLQAVDSELQQERQIRDKAREELNNLSLITEVNVGTVSETKTWKLGWTKHTKKFHLTSKFPISRIAKDVGPNVTLSPSTLVATYEGGLYVVQGEAEGAWILGVVRHFYLNVAAYCLGSDFYGEKIRSLEAAIRQHDVRIERLETRKLTILERNDDDQKELAKTQAFIDRFKEEAESLGRDTMKLGEAITRLEAMRAKEAREAVEARVRKRASDGTSMTGTADDISFSGPTVDAGAIVQVP